MANKAQIRSILSRRLLKYFGIVGDTSGIPAIDLLNNDALNALNYAGTAQIPLLKLTTGNVVVAPSGLTIPAGQPFSVPAASLSTLTTVTTLTTASALTYTAAQIDGGLILRDPNGAGRTDILPTAALLVAAIPGAVVGSSFRCFIRNTADANETITLSAGSGGTLNGVTTIAQNNDKEVLVILTNVTAASEAYTAYLFDQNYVPGPTGVALTSPRITTDISDANGNEIIKTPATGSAINEITITNSAAGNAVSIAATGGDTNIPLTVAGKGTGPVQLGQATSTDLRLVADQPIADSSGNELLKFVKTASAINELTVTNAAIGTSPLISATGGDTNVSVRLKGKGTGTISPETAMVDFGVVPAEITTAGAATFTAAQFLAKLILRDPNGAGRADKVPSAALMVAAIPGAIVGAAFEFTIRNTADANETITMTADDGATTISGTATIAQNNSKRFRLVLTNVTGSSEAYTLYSLGTVTT